MEHRNRNLSIALTLTSSNPVPDLLRRLTWALHPLPRLPQDSCSWNQNLIPSKIFAWANKVSEFTLNHLYFVIMLRYDISYPKHAPVQALSISIPIYPLQRVFYTQILSYIHEIEGMKFSICCFTFKAQK